MINRPQQTICLAMIVRDEAPVIERCLLAVKPFIHHWLIYDTGSQDNTREIITRILNDLPGRIEEHPLRSFADARNNLLDAAKDCCDLMLMVDADEQIESLEDAIGLEEGSDLGLAEIGQLGHTIRQARLFRSSVVPRFQFTVAEQIVDLDQYHTSPVNFSIKHHADGIRHRQTHDRLANRFFIESIIEGQLNDPAVCLVLAQIELRRNQLQRALPHLQRCMDSGENTAQFWQASYLAASIYQRSGDSGQAIALFHRCFESATGRPEPLMRIAEIHRAQGDNQTALGLCELIVEMPVSARANYFEPALYDYAARLLLAEICFEMGDLERSLATLEPLKALSRFPQNTQQRINGLRANAARSQTAEKSAEPPAPVVTAPPKSIVKSPIITIGMATHDDFDGVYFSIMSVVLYHAEFLDQIELLVVDNNPDSAHGASVRSLCERVSQARYIAAGEYNGTAVRERIFAEATGSLVLCMDCHVFLHAGAISRLLEYWRNNPASKDLLHGPLFYDNHEAHNTHMAPVWSAGFFGTWATDQRGSVIDGEAFEIPLQGMGLFACSREHWLGFNHRFRGFGGEEGYIHEKFRQNGGRVLCLPFLRWTHRFDRPNGATYVNRWDNRIRNYLIGWDELGLDKKPILEHFSELLGHSVAAAVNAEYLREIRGPLCQYDTIYCLIGNDEQWQQAQPCLERLAIKNIVQRIDRLEDISRLLQTAEVRGLPDVMVIDGRTAMTETLPAIVASLVAYNIKHSGTDWPDILSANSPTGDAAKPSGTTDAGLTAAHLILFQSRAFKAASQCYAAHRDISPDLMAQIDKSLTFEIFQGAPD